MSLFLDDTPGEGWLNNQERARYALNHRINVVKRGAADHDTLTHVSRDPCPKCGVRGDIGCKHKRAA